MLNQLNNKNNIVYQIRMFLHGYFRTNFDCYITSSQTLMIINLVKYYMTELKPQNNIDSKVILEYNDKKIRNHVKKLFKHCDKITKINFPIITSSSPSFISNKNCYNCLRINSLKYITSFQREDDILGGNHFRITAIINVYKCKHCNINTIHYNWIPMK